MNVNTLNTVGEKYRDFEITRVIDLEEIHCCLRELVHGPTGAKVMHIANDDSENVFCLSFQTLPDSSNGVAHILEHTVLCGSEKFPVKDPFFCMTRRSLNTFMNAFTGADFTCYPAASQVPQDFYNLLEVYLDAVMKPNLNEMSFMQEGHRLEFANPSDPNSSLEYRGVVYNEMKGAMSTPDSRLSVAFDETMFPDLTYGINSGGDPKIIPQLSYQELLDFHRRYYHPSRCLFYFYGNMPLEGHLDFLIQHTLKATTKKEALPALPKQKRFTKPKKHVVGYPFPQEKDPNEKSLIAFGWLTCNILEQKDLFALTVLSIVLLGTDASPLKKALLKSGLCKHVSTNIDDDISEVPISITLRGCNAENDKGLEKVIKTTLEKLIESGIPEDLVKGAIHQVEFHRSEIVDPYGLSLFMRCGLLKQHGGNPEDSLLIHSLCDHLRKTIQNDPNYLSSLIKKYLLDNTHRVCIVATPDKKLTQQEMQQERHELGNIHKKLNATGKEETIKKAKALADFQEKQEKENVDILPKITLAEVPKNSRDFLLTIENVKNLKIFHHNTFTNNIVYTDLIFPLPALEENELPLLKLFSLLLSQMGCGGRTYAENLDYIVAHTGGIGASVFINLQATDYNLFYPYFFIQAKALYHKVDKLFPLLHEMVTSTDFTDIPRLKEVIGKHFTVLQDAINQNALKYAINLSTSGLDMPSRISSAWGGLEYYYCIKNIAENFDTVIAKLVDQLQSFQQRILCLHEPHLVTTCDSEMYETLKQQHFYGLQDISAKSYQPWKSDAFTITEVPSQGRVIATPVAFTSKSFKTLPYIHQKTPALSVAAHLFNNLTLHPLIREQGGAYGGGAVNSTLSGNFYFYAYRDPNISSTFVAFDKAVQRVVNNDIKDSDLEEAKLEIIQGLDSPVAPGSRGQVAYSWLREGTPLELRQTFRDRLLALTREDVVEAVKTHILPKYNDGSTVIFAGRELLEKENDILISQGKKPLKIESV